MPRYGLRAASKLFRPNESQPQADDSQMIEWLNNAIERVKRYIQEIERIPEG
ncbi:MAG: hypothetical protein QXR44_04695 [Thermoproteota archaeon]